MPRQSTDDWQSQLERFEQELARVGVPYAGPGRLLWDLRPEGFILIADPRHEWYGPLEEAVERLAALVDDAGAGAFHDRFADWERKEL